MKLIAVVILFFTILIQAQTEISIDVLTEDNYTKTPIDSVNLLLWIEGELTDSAYTSNGSALFVLIATDIRNEIVPAQYSISNNYPNPFLDKTNILVNTKSESNLEIEIYNVLGERVYKKNIPAGYVQYELKMNLAGLAKGVYFVKILSGHEAAISKIVKITSASLAGNLSVQAVGGSGAQLTQSLAKLNSMNVSMSAVKESYVPGFVTFVSSADTSIVFSLQRENSISLSLLNEKLEEPEIQIFVTGPIDTTGVNPLVFTGPSGMYNIKTQSEKTIKVNETIEIASVDTNIAFSVRSIYRIEFEVLVNNNNEINMPLTISGEDTDTSLVAPFVLNLLPGEYDVTGDTDSTTAVDEKISVEQDRRFGFNVDYRFDNRSVVGFTVIDTTENNAAVGEKYIRFHPIETSVETDSLQLDSQGHASAEFENGTWIFRMSEDDTYAGFSIEVLILHDEDLEFGTESRKDVQLQLFDQRGHSVPAQMELTGREDVTVDAPGSKKLYNGNYTAVVTETDSTTALEEDFTVNGSGTKTFLIENLMNDIIITAMDTTVNDAPLANQELEYYPASNQSAKNTILLDSQGQATERIKDGDYIFKFNGTDLLASFQYSIAVTDDHSYTFGTMSKKAVTFNVAYPDEVGVNALELHVGGESVTTNLQGSANVNLFPGSYTVGTTDSRIENLDTGITVSADGEIKEFNALEKIAINYTGQTIDEDNMLDENLSQHVNVGTSIAEVKFVENDANILANGETITPNADYNGTAEFAIEVTAEHGTNKISPDYSLTINPMTDLQGHLYDAFDPDNPVVVEGVIEVDGIEYPVDTVNGFDFQISPAHEKTIKAWHTKNGIRNSFIVTHENVPANSDLADLGIYISNYDYLPEGVTPELQLEHAIEGMAKPGTTRFLVIDYHNPNNVLWIDKDFVESRTSEFGVMDTMSNEEQLWIKKMAEENVFPYVENKLPIYIAQPGDSYPIQQGYVSPIRGYMVAAQRKGPGGFQYGDYNYDDDFEIDAAFPTVGEPAIGNVRGTTEELASIYFTHGLITNTALNGFTIYHGKFPTDHLTNVDILSIRAGEQVLLNKEILIQEFELPTGETINRLYHPEGVEITKIFGL